MNKIKSLESAIYQEECSYRAELSKRKTQLKELSQQREYQNCTDEAEVALCGIEESRPIRVPFLLWAALGPANLVLPDRERIQYKASYERFKVLATVTHLLLSLILLVVRDQPWLDAVSNFLLLYAYSTMTLREHILRSNGSSMQRWWVWHHYLCVVLAGTLLVWPSGGSYHEMRRHLLTFMVYISTVQILQYRYQMNRLYTLRALSRIGPMQTTTDSASVHLFNSLAFLLPFILLGHLVQFYTAYKFGRLAIITEFREWQIIAIGVLFGLIATGNISTTLYTVIQKRRKSGAANSAASAIWIRRSRTFSGHIHKNE